MRNPVLTREPRTASPDPRNNEQLQGDGQVRSDAGSVKSAARVFRVLEAVADGGALSFSEVVERCGLPKSSAHALMRTMTSNGYLARGADERSYVLGLRLWQLAQRCHIANDLREACLPSMRRLTAETGETVQLASLDGVHAVYLAIWDSPHAVKHHSTEGSRLSAHASAVGKALLAQLDPADARQRLAQAPLEQLTENTLCDVDLLMEELAVIRERGVAFDREEFAIGLRCQAMPIRAADGRVVAAMSISMPTQRWSRQADTRARAALKLAVAEASEALGRR